MLTNSIIHFKMDYHHGSFVPLSQVPSTAPFSAKIHFATTNKKI